jgi:hypothetical protein
LWINDKWKDGAKNTLDEERKKKLASLEKKKLSDSGYRHMPVLCYYNVRRLDFDGEDEDWYN